ncbi:hypothetical protein AVEN_174944-1 [Araneus ventricosus]|uniref:Uncharacterized protein n=1 Tax=Araneus ventricosus TaxID=182803 RepID=A0A4Y2TT11_ARAVE|nr:hypothetical protein AVEN_33381-1 [Araneus ventricosus]GBO03241.1 hypothetical protein AVEN_174944-1 [Araneus ventricosus]
MSILPGSESMRLFLWAYLKSKVYLGGIQTLTILKDNILRTVLSIPCDMVTRNATFGRREYCVQDAMCCPREGWSGAMVHCNFISETLSVSSFAVKKVLH